MKIGIATDEGHVAVHFGRCQEYTLFDVDEDGRTITGKSSFESPEHEPGLLPRLLGERGVTVVIAGGMGPKAVGLFEERGIKVVTGVFGPVDEIAQAFVDGTLQTGDSTCDHID